MQVQIQKNEERMFENNIGDIQIKNFNNFDHKFDDNAIIEENVEEEQEEENEDYVF